jgi:Mn-containing catalase
LIANIGAEEFGRIELVSYALKPEGEEAASRDWTDGAHQSKAL